MVSSARIVERILLPFSKYNREVQMKVRVCFTHVPTVLHIGNSVELTFYLRIFRWPPNSLSTMPNQPTDEEILLYFGKNNRMDVHKKIPTPTNVPGGGYWLNNVEVNAEQLIDAYRKYAAKERIVMSIK